MKNLYYLDEPSAISFSGGRTSGYMLHRIIEAHGGKLPDHIKVTFANTGKEMPETLDFVNECGNQWGVDIVWLELGEYQFMGNYKTGERAGTPRNRATTKVVNYETASRQGEPFSRLIKNRKYLPNVMMRFCTSDLKVKRINQYLESIGYKDWIQCLGIRADEPRRAVKLNNKEDEGREIYLPLYLDGITKEIVGDFWKSQDFDLQLTNNNGVADFGNCDLCFLKGYQKRLSIMEQRPELADWWIEQERFVSAHTNRAAAKFRKDTPDYQKMKIIATDNLSFDFENDDSIGCFCGD